MRKELGLQEVSQDTSENKKKKKKKKASVIERRKYYGNCPVMRGQKKKQPAADLEIKNDSET